MNNTPDPSDLTGIQQRHDLQAALRDTITIISPDTLVIADDVSSATRFCI